MWASGRKRGWTREKERADEGEREGAIGRKRNNQGERGREKEREGRK